MRIIRYCVALLGLIAALKNGIGPLGGVRRPVGEVGEAGVVEPAVEADPYIVVAVSAGAVIANRAQQVGE